MPNLLMHPQFAVDRLYRADSAAAFRGEKKNLAWSSRAKGLVMKPAVTRSARQVASYTSAPIRAAFPFQEIVPSWNIRLNEDSQGYRIYIRVSNLRGTWSPWFYFGAGGTTLLQPGKLKRKGSKAWGEVDVDYLILKQPAAQFQYRVELENRGPLSPGSEGRVILQRFFVSYSNTSGDEVLYQNESKLKGPKRLKRSLSIKVPYRSQLAVPVKELRGQICCPTCVAMMLESHGIDKPTMDVCREAYDPETKIYGVWPRASQAAANNGLEAWIQRFRTHDQIKQMLVEGHPMMASIRVRNGELGNARYGSSAGHLILVTGFKADGTYIVNDPFSAGPGGKEIDYSAEDIGKVWLDKGGVGIIIRKPESQKE